MKVTLCLLICLFPQGAALLSAQDRPPTPTPSPSPSPSPSPLAALESSYAADRADLLRRVLARYVDELEVLEQSLAASGDAPGAARVREERGRVMPALGIPAAAPAVAPEDASDFAAFEEVTELPLPAPPLQLPGNLEAILKSLMPPSPEKPAAAPPAAGAPAMAAKGTNRGAKRMLRMSHAQLSGDYDPGYGYYYWTSWKHATWTVSDLTPGSYQLVLRYACDEKDEGGGKLLVQFGDSKVESKIPPTGGWKRRRELIIGPFEIKGTRADLMLKPASLAPGASYLMDLTAILVEPSASAAGTAKP